MKHIKTKIDLKQLTKEIQEMNCRHSLYKVLKVELTKLGHWKNLKRGKPNFGFRRKDNGQS